MQFHSPGTIPEVNWRSSPAVSAKPLRDYLKATAQASVGLNREAFATTLTPAEEVSGALHDLSAFWPDVGSRMREIQSALREDFGCDINPRSLKTLHQVLRQVPHVPRPRLGAGDDGTLAAIWAVGAAGIFTAEFLADGKVGCVALLDRGGPSYSETLEVSPRLRSLELPCQTETPPRAPLEGATPKVSPPRIPATHHVAGYCNHSSLDDDGCPTTLSFRLDTNGVSGNHVEWFDQDDLAAAMLGLQKWKLKQKNFTTRVSGRFAVMPVGDIIECTGAVVVEDPIENAECPLCSDPSHVLIQPSPDDEDAKRDFKTRLLQAVQTVHPARPRETSSAVP